MFGNITVSTAILVANSVLEEVEKNGCIETATDDVSITKDDVKLLATFVKAFEEEMEYLAAKVEKEFIQTMKGGNS